MEETKKRKREKKVNEKEGHLKSTLKPPIRAAEKKWYIHKCVMIFMFLVGLLLWTQRHSIENYPIKII